MAMAMCKNENKLRIPWFGVGFFIECACHDQIKKKKDMDVKFSL